MKTGTMTTDRTTGSDLLRCVVVIAGAPRGDGTVYDERGLMAAAGQFNLTHDEETDGRMDVAALDDGTPALFWSGPETAVELVSRPCPMGARGCRVDARGYHRRADGSLGIHEGAVPLEEADVVQEPSGSFLIPDTPAARAAAERAIRDLGIVPDTARPGETYVEAFTRKSNLALLEEASDFDAPRIGHRGDDSIPWKAPVLEPNPEFGPRRISDPLKPIFTGDRRDPRDFGDGPFDRPLPAEWNPHRRRPSGRSILLVAVFRAGVGLVFLAALLLLAAKLSGFTKVLGLEGAPGRSGAIVEPPVPSPLPTRAPSSGAAPRAATGGLALMVLLGMAFGGSRSGDTSVVRGKTRSTSARDAVIRECRSEGCEQKIVFLRYTKRDGSETRLPINLTAEAERRARADEPWEPNNPDLISHHSTCPFAEDWRKKRGGTGAPARGRR